MTEPRMLLLEAIVGRKLVEATYNGETLRLAPHILYTRNGDLFVDAFNLAKVWRSEDDQTLGSFKLAGLRALSLLEQSFARLPFFDPGEEKYQECAVLSVE